MLPPKRGEKEHFKAPLTDQEKAEKVDEQAICNADDEWVYSKPLQGLQILVLRDYLSHEFKIFEQPRYLPFRYDFERVIDDFVFLCFFVGNDFLPHLPSLDIRDGALDFLMELYKQLLPSLGDYITSPGGVVNLRQVDVILSRVGEIEDEIFKRRQFANENADARRARSRHADSNIHSKPNRQERLEQNQDVIDLALASNSIVSVKDTKKMKIEVQSDMNGASTPVAPVVEVVSVPPCTPVSSVAIPVPAPIATADDEDDDIVLDGDDDEEAAFEGEILTRKRAVELMSSDENDPEKITTSEPADSAVAPQEKVVATLDDVKNRMKAKQQMKIEKNKKAIQDAVRLHESGWRERYYQDPHKKKDIEEGGGLKHMCYTYIQGLCWVFKYYYVGCPSWNWYYPFHYSPFASDLVNIDKFDIHFEMSSPFRPIEQLLTVFPPESAHALPEACQPLMLSDKSPIIDFYTADVEIDPDGKALPWLWVLLLPFIDPSRVVTAFKDVEAELSVHEKDRNARKHPLIFISKNHPMAISIEKAKMTYPKKTAGVMKPIYTEADEALVVSQSEGFLLGDVEVEPDKVSTDTTSAVESEASDTDNTANQLIVSHSNGDGASGLLMLAPSSTHAPLDQMILAPSEPMGCFMDLRSNQVYGFTFKIPLNNEEYDGQEGRNEACTTNSPLLTITKDYDSKLLPNCTIPPSILTEYDTIARRPPRLNKGGFNMLDLARRKSDGQQHQNYNGSYGNNQYSSYNSFSNNGYNSNNGSVNNNSFNNQQYASNYNRNSNYNEGNSYSSYASNPYNRTQSNNSYIERYNTNGHGNNGNNGSVPYYHKYYQTPPQSQTYNSAQQTRPNNSFASNPLFRNNANIINDASGNRRAVDNRSAAQQLKSNVSYGAMVGVNQVRNQGHGMVDHHGMHMDRGLTGAPYQPPPRNHTYNSTLNQGQYQHQNAVNNTHNRKVPPPVSKHSVHAPDPSQLVPLGKGNKSNSSFWQHSNTASGGHQQPTSNGGGNGARFSFSNPGGGYGTGNAYK